MQVKYIKSSDIRAKDFNDLVEKYYPEMLESKEPELILVAGGDGAMMRAIRKYNHLDVPFLGIARGSFNFLLNEIDNAKDFLEKLSQNKITTHLQETQTIKVKHGEENIGYAANDIILGTSINGYHHFEINTEDETISNLEVKGTGLCISTDLGSTAYSYNLGNPALPLEHNLLIISGIVCNKYINDIVQIQKITIKIKSNRSSCNIFIDGIEQDKPLETNQTITLEKGKPVKIALLSLKDFKSKRKGISNRHRNFI